MGEWISKELCQIAKITKGQQLNKTCLFSHGDYYVLNGGIEPSGYYDKWNTEANTISISEGGNSCGYVNYNSERFWSGGHCYSLSKINDISTECLFHILKYRQPDIMALRVGSGLPNIQRKALSSFELFFPLDIDEQGKIAQVLSMIDIAISKTKVIIEKYNSIKIGLMQDLLANGIDENGVIRSPETHEYKDSPLGKIPVEWNDTTVKLNFKLRARIGWQGLKASEFIEDGPFVVTGTDFELGKINWDNCYHVSYKRYEQDAGIQLHDGDLVITKDGTIGKTAFITDCPSQTTLNSGVFVIRPKNNGISSKYFYYILNSRYFEQFMRNYLTGSTIKHLNQEIFYDMVIVVPKNIDEQNRIVNKLDSIQNAIYKEIEYLKKYDQIKQGLLQDILTHKVSVEPLLERSVENE